MLHDEARHQQSAGVAPVAADAMAFPGQQDGRQDVIERARGEARVLLRVGVRGDALGVVDRAVAECGEAVAIDGGDALGFRQQPVQLGAQRALCLRPGDGAAHDVDRIDDAGALPQHGNEGIAQQAGVDPVLDDPVAAANLDGLGGRLHVVAVAAHLDDGRDDAQELRGGVRAFLAAAQDIGAVARRGKRLLGRNQNLQELPAHQGLAQRGLAEQRP